MDARAYLLECAPLVERALEAALAAGAPPPERLRRALHHALFPGGKRLRPGLALAAAEAVGAPRESALPMAVAVEFVHTYSLVHDDLPCMDDDDERRGRPSLHVAFDEATAVLAGDALLTAAFEVLAGDAAAVAPPADRRLAALRELARSAGWGGLVGGQVDDLDFDAASADAARVESIHARKSAELIAAAAVGGACLGGAGEPALARLRRFGGLVGVAFQIADDLLDADEDAGCSLVPLVGAEAAGARAEALLEAALAELEELGERAEPLRALARFAVRRDA